MMAFELRGKSTRLVRDRPRPTPAPGMARVKLLEAGICNTDLELARGYMGFSGVLGHEFVGLALDGPLAGRRVVGGINFGCGTCAACMAGMARHCPTRRVLGILDADGALAEEFLIPEANLLPVPDTLVDDDAVFAEPLAAACEILEQLGDDRRAGRALVLGAGKLGPLIAQVLAAAGFEVSITGRYLGTVAWLEDRGVRLLEQCPADAHYGLVVEATGSREGLERALSATAPRGTLVLKTTVAHKHEIDLAPVVINEITILGSRCGRLESALELLSTGRVDVQPLITARYGLAEVEEAFRRAATPGARKIVVEAS
jgi:threonine dehydrogenase-like Zn-dependent dehydrogenase